MVLVEVYTGPDIFAMMHSAFKHLCIANFDAKIHLFSDLFFDFLNHPMCWVVWKDKIRDSGQDQEAIEIGSDSFLQCWILYLYCHFLSRFELCLMHLDAHVRDAIWPGMADLGDRRRSCCHFVDSMKERSISVSQFFAQRLVYAFKRLWSAMVMQLT